MVVIARLAAMQRSMELLSELICYPRGSEKRGCWNVGTMICSTVAEFSSFIGNL